MIAQCPLYAISVRSACKSLQICGYFSTFPLFCLGNCHIDALEPLFCVLLILGLENIGFIVCEDFKSSREGAVPAFPGHNFHTLYFAEFYWGVIRIIFLKCIWEGENMSWLPEYEKISGSWRIFQENQNPFTATGS